ncbi:hypothetical protein GCM10027034_07100 [Ramlibacter solisilvae]|uniref:helix-turn-helix domain-containing protein n=1 Tax=Ramlibacter tataouinensis TaxID=94132 RepID=UPI001D107CA2|nr:helix-turn-helix domain-containing protein [Ramlibacter tataouinensis]
MSELAASPEAGIGADGVTAGLLLRRAREAAGLHVAALAVSLKVPVRKLEALEGDRYDLLPDAVFARALASSVCRTLKLDPQPVLQRLPQTATPRLIQSTDGLNAPFRTPGDAKPSWIDHLRQPVFLAVLALLLGALVLILVPNTRFEDTLAPAAAPQPAAAVETVALPPAAAATQAAPPDAQNPTTAAAPAADATAAALAPAAPASAAVAATPVAPAAAAPAPAAAAVAQPAASAAAPAAAFTAAAAPAQAGLVVIRTKGESWVDVTDAKGVVALRKTLTAGESAGASGTLPLQVTIGRVDMTEVTVRGKPFDMRPVSRDNVARFEVK